LDSEHHQVEHLGLVAAITPIDDSASGGNGFSMTISDSAPILDDCHIGDSICVNGACLTVTEFGKDWFKVGLAPETLDRTDLGTSFAIRYRIFTYRHTGERKVGDYVNLERAMAAHVRFGGHFVQVSYYRSFFLPYLTLINSTRRATLTTRLLFSPASPMSIPYV
jgi:riboflavin synthase